MSAFLGLSVLHDPHLVLWLTAPLLALAGVTVIARDHVFAGAALSHAAALGVVMATTVPPFLGNDYPAWLSHDGLETAMAVTLAVAAAFALRGNAASARESMNGVFAWAVLGAASASCLLAAHHERAAVELTNLLTSAVLVAEPSNVLVFAAALAAASALVVSSRRKIVLLTIDAPMAEAVGMRVTLWTIALPLALGIVIAFSVRAAGLLYTFGCLVLAPLVARSFCREIGPMFWVAPVVGIVASALGVAAAARYGLPPAQLIVLVECVLLVPAWGIRRVLARGEGSVGLSERIVPHAQDGSREHG